MTKQTNVLGQKALTTINKAWLASTGTRNLTHYVIFICSMVNICKKKCTFIKLIYFSKSYCTVKKNIHVHAGTME